MEDHPDRARGTPERSTNLLIGQAEVHPHDDHCTGAVAETAEDIGELDKVIGHIPVTTTDSIEGALLCGPAPVPAVACIHDGALQIRSRLLDHLESVGT